MLHTNPIVDYIASMKLMINGVAEELKPAQATVAGLLAAKRWSFPLIIVKVNGKPVQRDAWITTAVSDGDVVEAVHLMSGG